ncbi:MAG: hypothetical protein ACPGPE_12805, partial [Planctomycetota bacterium]
MRGIVTGEEATGTSPGDLKVRGVRSRTGVLAAALLVLSGCGGPTRRATPVRDPGVSARSHPIPASAGPAPAWSMLPTSWGKLTEIERWKAD